MMIRSEGDVVRAANMAYDLSGIVTSYLKLHREYINGYNGVIVTDKEFAIVFLPKSKEGCICVELHWIDTITYSTPMYYDTDSDYFVESMGGQEPYGYDHESISSLESSSIHIPISHLLQNQEDMLEFFKLKKIQIEKDRVKLETQRRISHLKNELKSLCEEHDLHP